MKLFGAAAVLAVSVYSVLSTAYATEPMPRPNGLLLPLPKDARRSAVPQHTSRYQAPVRRDVAVPSNDWQVPEPPSDEHFYWASKLGLVALDDLGQASSTATVTTEFDTGYLLSGALGYQFNPYLRSELEVAYRDNEVDAVTARSGSSVATSGGDNLGFEAFTFMLNGYVQYPISAQLNVTPYVGAGVGAMKQVNGAKESGFAYQLMTGMEWKLRHDLMLSAGYRFQEAPDLFESEIGDFDATSHSVELGFRVAF